MPQQPNIILFNPDQWRGDVLGYVGNPGAVTPNLDHSVTSDAVGFRWAFCQNPVCTPSRCSFMTGWYPHTLGHRTMYHMLQQHEPMMLTELKSAGYRVWWGGKNDLLPGQQGWERATDVYFRSKSPMRDIYATTERLTQTDPGYYSFYRGRLEVAPDGHPLDYDWAMVLGAIDEIENGPRDRPLCIYLPLSYPHPEYRCEDPFYTEIDRAALPPRTAAPLDWQGKPSILRGIAELQNLQEWDEARWIELRATYYAMCARVDHQWGLISEALRRSGRYDDTAMMLFSDHGDFTGDYGLVEKTQNTFEDCLSRVPLVIKPPAGVQVKPRVTEALAELVDIPATVYELAGLEPRYTNFGSSLLPVLAGAEEHRDAVFCEGGRLKGERHCMELQSASSTKSENLYWPRIYWQTSDEGVYHTKASMCRDHRYKYVRRFYEQDEFYDLQHDPMELDNRIDDPGYTLEISRLKERMLTWYQETCDVVPWDGDARDFDQQPIDWTEVIPEQRPLRKL